MLRSWGVSTSLSSSAAVCCRERPPCRYEPPWSRLNATEVVPYFTLTYKSGEVASRIQQSTNLQESSLMLGAKLDAADYLGRLTEELARVDLAELKRWADLVYAAWRDDRFVFIFGNGGSGTTATHMSEDFGKSLLRQDHLRDESRRRLKVMSLTDNTGWILAVGNDCGY